MMKSLFVLLAALLLSATQFAVVADAKSSYGSGVNYGSFGRNSSVRAGVHTNHANTMTPNTHYIGGDNVSTWASRNKDVKLTRGENGKLKIQKTKIATPENKLKQ